MGRGSLPQNPHLLARADLSLLFSYRSPSSVEASSLLTAGEGCREYLSAKHSSQIFLLYLRISGTTLSISIHYYCLFTPPTISHSWGGRLLHL